MSNRIKCFYNINKFVVKIFVKYVMMNKYDIGNKSD